FDGAADRRCAADREHGAFAWDRSGIPDGESAHHADRAAAVALRHYGEKCGVLRFGSGASAVDSGRARGSSDSDASDDRLRRNAGAPGGSTIDQAERASFRDLASDDPGVLPDPRNPAEARKGLHGTGYVEEPACRDYQ